MSSSRDADPTGAVFKRGVVYRGVYFPSLTSAFRDDRLESAYQRYAHRQRQKALIIVNAVDATLKILFIVLLLVDYTVQWTVIIVKPSFSVIHVQNPCLNGKRCSQRVDSNILSYSC